MKTQQSRPVHRQAWGGPREPSGFCAGFAPGGWRDRRHWVTMQPRRCETGAAGTIVRGENIVESIVFGISLFLGVAAVALVAFTLLLIALGKVDV